MTPSHSPITILSLLLLICVIAINASNQSQYRYRRNQVEEQQTPSTEEEQEDDLDEMFRACRANLMTLVKSVCRQPDGSTCIRPPPRHPSVSRQDNDDYRQSNGIASRCCTRACSKRFLLRFCCRDDDGMVEEEETLFGPVRTNPRQPEDTELFGPISTEQQSSEQELN